MLLGDVLQGVHTLLLGGCTARGTHTHCYWVMYCKEYTHCYWVMYCKGYTHCYWVMYCKGYTHTVTGWCTARRKHTHCYWVTHRNGYIHTVIEVNVLQWVHTLLLGKRTRRSELTSTLRELPRLTGCKATTFNQSTDLNCLSVTTRHVHPHHRLVEVWVGGLDDRVVQVLLGDRNKHRHGFGESTQS